MGAGGQGRHEKGEQEKLGEAVEEQVKGLVASGKAGKDAQQQSMMVFGPDSEILTQLYCFLPVQLGATYLTLYLRFLSCNTSSSLRVLQEGGQVSKDPSTWKARDACCQLYFQKAGSPPRAGL